MDAGVIASLKVLYRRWQIERGLYKLDAGAKHIYNVNQLQAMVEVRRIWKEMSRDTILNCWIHAGILDEKIPPEATVTDLEDRSGIEEEVEGMVNQLVGSRARISIAKF